MGVALPLLTGATAWAMGEGLRRVFEPLLMAGMIGGAWGFPLALLLAVLATRRVRSGRVHADHGGLHLPSETIPFDDVAVAWQRVGHQVEVVLHSGDELLIEPKTPEAARALASIVRRGLGGRRAYSLAGEGPALRISRQLLGWTLPLAAIVPFAALEPSLAALAPAALAISVGIAWGSRRVRFAADGLTIEGRFRKRFIAYRDIEAVGLAELGPLHAVRVRVGGSWVTVVAAAPLARAQAIHALVEEGMRMAERGAEAGAHVPALERLGAEDDEALREKLAALAKGGGYRGPAIDPSRLDQLMRNPAAANDQRVAAALALRETPEGRAKTRVAAEASAEPDVRDALEALAEEELELEEARSIVRRIGRK